MTERRIAWVLGVVLLGMVLLLATSAFAAGSADGSVVQRSFLRAVGPVARTAATVREWLGGVGGGLESRESLRRRNEALTEEVRDLRLELFQLRNLERQVDRLAEAVRYDVPVEGDLQAADIVYADSQSRMGALILYVGQGAPVTVNQPVVNAQGLVGRIAFVSGPYAKVQLLTDRSATVGARIERTRRQGLLRGELDGGLSLDYVPLQNDVRVGDRVRTSGIDGVYPPGIRIGTVVSVEPGRQLFHDIEVQTEVDFGRLDQVYLLPLQEVPEDLEEDPS